VTEGVGLESIGVFTERGILVTDDKLRTNVPDVWAAGDVNGRSMLAHTAYREAEVAVNDMLGKPDPMRYDAIPSVIYTDPEAAGVGETEETATAKGMKVYVEKLPMNYAGRFVAETDRQEGLCKLIFEEGTNRLVGAHLIGSYASEIILSAGTMINTHWPLEALKKIVFAHPTVGEILRETMFEA
jgi:dihydrolipoamide dehydrogenase